MALSPNYSWPEPNDSDFVKNGADAMRDLGDAIDATLYAQLSAIIHPFLLMGA
jgi:hypothetical protein